MSGSIQKPEEQRLRFLSRERAEHWLQASAEIVTPEKLRRAVGQFAWHDECVGQVEPQAGRCRAQIRTSVLDKKLIFHGGEG